MGAMRVGLMGLGRGGWRVAQILLQSSWCELTAVASQKSKAIEQFSAEHPGVATYDDFRSMIVASPLDALFVAAPPHQRVKYLPLAAERKIPVWMLSPAMRQFAEAVELMERFEKAECPIAVSRSWGIEPAMQADSLALEQAGKFFLGRGEAMICWDDDLDWRGDSQRAGGGVLLYRAYTVVDALVQAMGTPSQVYARMSGVSRPGGRFPYDTEDTAGLVCQFPGGGVAVVTTCWTAGPTATTLGLFGMGASIHIEPERIVVHDRTGTKVLSERERSPNPLQPQVEGFLSELAASPRRIRATLRQHLPTMAVIQAAYLSAQTGQPESPARFYAMHNLGQPRSG